MDNRGVSAVLGYVLTLAITTVLISGLLLASGGFVESQHERAVSSEFEVIGNRIAADLAAVDRLALAAGPNGRAELRTDLPARAASIQYRINISSVAGLDDVYQIDLTATGLDANVTVRVTAETDVVEGAVTGGDVRIVYNGSHLEVRDV